MQSRAHRGLETLQVGPEGDQGRSLSLSLPLSPDSEWSGISKLNSSAYDFVLMCIIVKDNEVKNSGLLGFVETILCSVCSVNMWRGVPGGCGALKAPGMSKRSGLRQTRHIIPSGDPHSMS